MKAQPSQASYAKRNERLIPYDAALITARSEQLIEAPIALTRRFGWSKASMILCKATHP